MNGQNGSSHMMFSTFCLAIGFMISPMSLAILGNSLGILGYRLLGILPLMAMISLWTANLYSRILKTNAAENSKTGTDPAWPWIFTSMKIAALVPFCIGISTLILAMAGYALNEIFLYWFPNLVFSVSLLLLITALNMTTPRISKKLQSWSVIIFLASMLLLVVLGVVNREKPVPETVEMSFPAAMGWRSMAMVFWLFMAAELAVYHDAVHQHLRSHPSSIMAACVAAAVIFLLWGYTSLHFVSHERLAASTVPHSVVARALSGESGRTIMGVAILAGSFASVNTLLAGVSAVLTSMAGSGQIFPALSKKILEGHAGMMVLSIGIMSMLLTGMAGKDITHTITVAAFYLWLISQAAFNGYAFHWLRYSGERENRSLMLPLIPACLLYGAATVVLVATDPDFSMTLAFIVGFITLSILITQKKGY